MARFAFNWTNRRDANDADERRGIEAAEKFCGDHGIDPAATYDAMQNAVEQWPQTAADQAAIDAWSQIEAAAISAMCDGWVSQTENATLIFEA